MWHSPHTKKRLNCMRLFYYHTTASNCFSFLIWITACRAKIKTKSSKRHIIIDELWTENTIRLLALNRTIWDFDLPFSFYCPQTSYPWWTVISSRLTTNMTLHLAGDSKCITIPNRSLKCSFPHLSRYFCCLYSMTLRRRGVIE